MTLFVLAGGILTVAVAFVAGDHPAARRVRRDPAVLRAAVTGDRGSDLAVWVAAHAAGIRAAGLMVVLAVVVDISWVQALLLLALLGGCRRSGYRHRRGDANLVGRRAGECGALVAERCVPRGDLG